MDARDFLPDQPGDLEALRDASRVCRGCDLYRDATQTVFGEGPADAALMAVGEQPGDREDKEGSPFVGPAGALLDRAFDEAGVDRTQLYVTNAVKHFKWEPRGPRRLHKTPTVGERTACRPWLLAEIEAIGPEVVLCLGASAGQALLGPTFRVTTQRGKLLDGPGGVRVMGTIHPSAVLRLQAGDRAEAYGGLVHDLRRAWEHATP
ncbi:MAG TPA: UdgX family uracil-DNA binding protein [Acidimicrobiales bacterium]|jgi:DNA polymerase|nr:UdgX family uracil-DNA binding protein [Acidimicrobiales bacterium]